MKKGTKVTATGTAATKGGKGAVEKLEPKPRKRFRYIPDREQIDFEYGKGWYDRFGFLDFPNEFYTKETVELFKMTIPICTTNPSTPL